MRQYVKMCRQNWWLFLMFPVILSHHVEVIGNVKMWFWKIARIARIFIDWEGEKCDTNTTMERHFHSVCSSVNYLIWKRQQTCVNAWCMPNDYYGMGIGIEDARIEYRIFDEAVRIGLCLTKAYGGWWYRHENSTHNRLRYVAIAIALAMYISNTQHF